MPAFAVPNHFTLNTLGRHKILSILGLDLISVGSKNIERIARFSKELESSGPENP
jgi:hypothetical protein